MCTDKQDKAAVLEHSVEESLLPFQGLAKATMSEVVMMLANTNTVMQVALTEISAIMLKRAQERKRDRQNFPIIICMYLDKT